MTAVAQPTGYRFHGFGGVGAIVLFAAGVAAVVIGALVLADGILDYLNIATVFLGSVGWWINVAVGAVVVAGGAVLVGFSRRVHW